MIEHCRSLRHMLSAGLTVAQAMKHQAKSGPTLLRPIAKRIAAQLGEGDDLQTALREEARFFPPLYLAIGAVAEETGTLPEALKELEDFFTLQNSLWKRFIAQITWPIVQFVLATLIVSLLIYLLGFIASGSHGLKVLGLQGGSGAAIFFFGVWGSILALFVFIQFCRHGIGRGPAIDRFFLRLFALGPALEAMALSRFSLAMSVTLEAGVPVAEAVRLSLESTNNYAYMDRIKPAQAMIKTGQSLSESLGDQHIFPEQFISIVETAEISGNEPEVFYRQSKQYSEIAEVRLRVLATAAYWIVWGLVAVFIIVLIFNIWNQVLNQYT
jgi:type IV pilus assembly protein PilC